MEKIIALFAGIVPRQLGAIAVVDHQGQIAIVADIPTQRARHGQRIAAYEVAEILHRQRRQTGGIYALAAMELATSRQSFGISSTFSFDRAFGAIEAIICLSDTPCQAVTPNTWKKAFDLHGQDDGVIIEKTKTIFPAARLENMKDHGKAEALLLAEYARRCWIYKT